jgi:hypothetical protein
MSKDGDFLIGERALHAVCVVAEAVVTVVVVCILRFMDVVLGGRRVGEMFRVKLTEVILSTLLGLRHLCSTLSRFRVQWTSVLPAASHTLCSNIWRTRSMDLLTAVTVGIWSSIDTRGQHEGGVGTRMLVRVGERLESRNFGTGIHAITRRDHPTAAWRNDQIWGNDVCAINPPDAPLPYRYPTCIQLLPTRSTMKPASLFAYPAATACLILAASAAPRPLSDIIEAFDIHQLPLLPNPLADMPSDDSVSTGVIISDVIGKTQAIAIFSGLTRDIDPVSGRLDDASQNATVLAPDNSAMKNLKRKPWEDAEDYEAFGAEAYKGQDGENRAHKNLRSFVERHIVPESPWAEGKKVKTLNGNEVWWETKDGKKKVWFGPRGAWQAC